jgi:dTDP-4-dehydrorhamnose reductase
LAKGKRLLITGASGFVGGSVAFDLQNLGYDVIPARHINDVATPLNENSPAVFLSLADKSSLVETAGSVRPDVVLHFAALGDAGKCERDPSAAFSANAQGTKNLVESLETLQEKPLLIYSSTDLVFDGGEAPEGGFVESDAAQPASAYSKSKYEGELNAAEYSGKSVTMRLSLVYGMKVGSRGGALSWIRSRLANDAGVNLFEDEWRTPVYTRDISIACDRLIANRGSLKDGSQLFHLGGAERLSRTEFGEAVCRVIGYSVEKIKRELRAEAAVVPPRPKDVSLNSTLISKQLGFELHAVEDALRDIKQREYLS